MITRILEQHGGIEPTIEILDSVPITRISRFYTFWNHSKIQTHLISYN